MMTGNSIKYLCALLNAKLTHWSLRQNSPQLGAEALHWEKLYGETIPKIPAAEQLPFIRLVDCILAPNASNSRQNVVDWEKEIDRLVYQLYDLTANEIATIEN